MLYRHKSSDRLKRLKRLLRFSVNAQKIRSNTAKFAILIYNIIILIYINNYPSISVSKSVFCKKDAEAFEALV